MDLSEGVLELQYIGMLSSLRYWPLTLRGHSLTMASLPILLSPDVIMTSKSGFVFTKDLQFQRLKFVKSVNILHEITN